MSSDNPPTDSVEAEISAISAVYSALKPLERDAQQRVLEYVSQKLSLKAVPPPSLAEPQPAPVREQNFPAGRDDEEDSDGISPVAAKWMRRSGLSREQLGPFFSLGLDEIDLVAKSVPGKGGKDRMRSVFLLKGIAAYLSGGAARFTHEQAKEACLHYDAYDGGNFSRYVKSISSEVSGTKESGYTLTAHGMTSATALLKQMVGSPAAG